MSQKILLINQHSSNHGDEAAGKALINSLNLKKNDVSILYNTVSEKAIIDFGIQFQKILLTKSLDKISKVLLMSSFFIPHKMLVPFFSKELQEEYLLIKNSDIVISMPGGANIGLYHDWRYLWRLYIALALRKKVAIYSTSIGPFKENLFKQISKNVLSKVNFLSLRDAQSFRYADEMHLKYIKSIDTAFLTQPIIKDFNLESVGVPFKEKDYVVFVANDLTSGHLTFKSVKPEDLKNIYKKIIISLIEKNKKIVFLPQLFANGNDKDYFKLLLDELDYSANPNIIIVDENFSSDIQQNIVRLSSFVIGARYHSIIFSINNKVPFLCLSYENKMKNTLEILGFDKYGVDLSRLVDLKDVFSFENEILSKLESLLSQESEIDNTEAKRIVESCFISFEKDFLQNIN